MKKVFTNETGHPDEEWIDRLKEGDDRTLQALYAACYRTVENYVLENSGSAEDAKDIYQEAFIAVWRNIQLGKVSLSTMDKLRGYLFRVAQYKWLDQLRSGSRRKTNALDMETMEEVAVDMDTDDEEYLQKVKASFALLGEPCKDVLYRFYFLKQKMEEIAAFFSWTGPSARNNKYRCLQRLRNMVLPQNKNQ